MLRTLISFGPKSTPNSQNDDKENYYLFPKVDTESDGADCLKDCADCTIQFPSKVKVETSRSLYGQIKGFHAHILVATGRTDWKEKVEQESGSLMEALDQPSAKSKHGV
jgi:hypothetical protein